MPGPPGRNGLLNQTLINVGIVSAQRTFSLVDNDGAVSLTLVNNSTSMARRRLSVSAGDKELTHRDLEVPLATTA